MENFTSKHKNVNLKCSKKKLDTFIFSLIANRQTSKAENEYLVRYNKIKLPLISTT